MRPYVAMIALTLLPSAANLGLSVVGCEVSAIPGANRVRLSFATIRSSFVVGTLRTIY